jgi:hypothetical protein
MIRNMAPMMDGDGGKEAGPNSNAGRSLAEPAGAMCSDWC